MPPRAAWEGKVPSSDLGRFEWQIEVGRAEISSLSGSRVHTGRLAVANSLRRRFRRHAPIRDFLYSLSRHANRLDRHVNTAPRKTLGNHSRRDRSSAPARRSGYSSGPSALAYVASVYLLFEYLRLHEIYTFVNFVAWPAVMLYVGLILCAHAVATDGLKRDLTLLTALGTFVIAILLSIWLGSYPAYGMRYLDVVLSWCVATWVVSRSMTSIPSAVLVLATYYICNVKMAQHGFRSWVEGGFGFSSWGVSGSPVWFSNSGEFGLQMAVFTPLAMAAVVYCWREYKLNWRTWLSGLVLVAAVSSIIASGSRGGLIALCVSILILALQSPKKIRGLAAAALLLTTIWLAAPAEFRARFDTMGTDETSVLRLTYWSGAMDAWRSSPYFGMGYMGWMEYSRNVLRPRVEMWRAEQIHNTSLQILSETGLVGTAAFLSLLFLGVSALRTVVREAPNQYPWLRLVATAQLASVISYLAGAQFMSIAYYPFFWMWLAMGWGLANAVRTLGTSESEAKAGPIRVRRRVAGRARRSGR
jgi:putative inorganic carbon (hco3(-)) transporter